MGTYGFSILFLNIHTLTGLMYCTYLTNYQSYINQIKNMLQNWLKSVYNHIHTHATIMFITIQIAIVQILKWFSKLYTD